MNHGIPEIKVRVINKKESIKIFMWEIPIETYSRMN